MVTADLAHLQGVRPEDWLDWRWHIGHCIRTLDALRQWITITPQEEEAIRETSSRYRWQITPYYASLMDKSDPNCPIRRQAIPSLQELDHIPAADVDPVGDRSYRKTNRVIHKYPDRVIMLVTHVCPVYCRHCTRKYHTTDLHGTYFEKAERNSFDEDFDYIGRNPNIRDVLLTGGDPLVYSDEKLEFIISRLRSISHVEIIRIGSRFPVLLPQRITSSFCTMLEKFQPVWFSTHFNHVREITTDSAAACDRLLRHGVPVQNQSVLLKGINDEFTALRELLLGLVKIRVRPYYLYHCDNVVGVSHFMTDLAEGRDLYNRLLGNITGFAIPQYVLTTEIGKIPLSRSYTVKTETGFDLENYEGRTISLQESRDRKAERCP
jgi:lysine 2,3-aminomutase